MNFVDAVKTCFNKYACFEGRACRSEYWYFCLFNVIASWVVSLVFTLIGVPALAYVYTLAVFLPSLAVVVRRLHDIGKIGWFWLIGFIPLIGGIWLIILFCKKGDEEANQYGENPLNQQVAE